MYNLDLLHSAAVKVAAIATVLVGALGWVDLRYASASDLKTHMQAADRRFINKTTEEYEESILIAEDEEESILIAEDELAVLEAKKAVRDLTAEEALIENQLKNRRARYLRKLKSIRSHN
jgi:hypothetical protein